MMKITKAAELRDLLADLPAKHAAIEAAARQRQGRLVKPPGSLGRLEDIAVHLAAWQGNVTPRADAVRIIVFAGSHGVTRYGVSPYPDAVNAQMLAGFRAGIAAINQLARAFDASLTAIDCGVDRPTGDMTATAALDEEEFVAAVNTGLGAVSGAEELLILGDMGIGNTTAAAALAAALFGGGGVDWAGPGAGLDSQGVRNKAAIVDRALRHHGAALKDPIEAARRVGGRELAAIMGAALAARLHRVPLLLDGFIVTSAVAPLLRLAPGALDHAIAAHESGEPAHRRCLHAMGLVPLLSLGMRLGEASGAAAAIGLVRAAVACHNGMATFEEAQVSGPSA
ncbi:nicotinate-nucleotide--dimethylbenzimidazole phosphoribosyltransferase [Desertibaculum subflavum]|uniref:nicotinate-nucleotide--dimethylbenzimidazole phosphoribosyltransferase n=1 Tax=Desertibaculum subflavum TaxID=2268458 RepID=UPI000E666B3A